MQFYLIWPLLFYLYKKSFRLPGRKRACFFFLIPAFLSLAAMICLYHPGSDPSRVYYGTDTMGFTLFLGMFLGALRHNYPVLCTPVSRKRQLPVFSGMFGITLLLFLLVKGSNSFLYLGGMFVISVFFAVMILFTENQRTLAQELPLASQTALLGKYSYNIYLWHYPVIVLLLTAFH